MLSIHYLLLSDSDPASLVLVGAISTVSIAKSQSLGALAFLMATQSHPHQFIVCNTLGKLAFVLW